VASQADLIGEMELIDIILTTDEAKVATGSFAEFVKSGETFEIKGESIGFLHSADESHTRAPYPDQLNNYIRDENLKRAFADYYVVNAQKKIERWFTLARGDVSANMSKVMSDILRKKDIESIDEVNADMFELGVGLHPVLVDVIDHIVQKRGIIPAIKMENQSGVSEKIEWDMEELLERNEVRISKKNANVVYAAYAEDKGIKAKEAKKIDIDTINEWLADEATPDIFLLGYRSPTPHVNGAAMVRVHSIHTSSDVVFMHPYNIFANFEGDGDGDTFNMVKLPAELTDIYREYYSSDEIRQQLAPISLDKFLDKDPREYKFSSKKDMYELMSAFIRGKNAISEIAKTQRIYGQLLDVLQVMEIDGERIKLMPPGQIVRVNHFKEGAKYTISDYLRIYLQAAVDNSKYMLLDKWGYDSDLLRRSLWVKEDGTGITDNQWKVVKELMNKHGETSNIRSGRDSKLGIWSLQTMIQEGRKYIAYTGYNKETKTPGIGYIREMYFRELINNKYPNISIGELKFKDGISSQEALIVLPTIAYDSRLSRSGEDGSPFKFLGWDRLSEKNIDTRYHISHDRTMIEIQKFKEDMGPISEDDYNAGFFYGGDMGRALYAMYTSFRTKNIDPGFQGWTHNETMVKFLEKWSGEFEKLSDNAKKVATFVFLEGVKRVEANVRYPHQIPPVSKRKLGKTLLDPVVMEKYWKAYNKHLMDPDLARDDTIQRNSKHNGIISFIIKKCP
jgi:hypothetical protein